MSEARREAIQTLAAAANEVEPLYNDYLKTRNEFNDIVARYAETLVTKTKAYQSKQFQYQTIIQQLNPSLTDAELSELKLSEKAKTLAGTSHINRPPIEYDKVIITAVKL